MFLKALNKTKNLLGAGISQIFSGTKASDPGQLKEMEALLIKADVGLSLSQQILKQIRGEQPVLEQLKQILDKLIIEAKLELKAKPHVVLLVGANGTGKTTTCAKLANYWQQQGKSIMLAAGDTFRAAASEQLEHWGRELNLPVISPGQAKADSAALIFDAMQSAKTKEIDILIADTAGRLHNKEHLLQELQKVIKVLGKLDPSAPHSILLVLDASSGQNTLMQAKVFTQHLKVDGIILNKLDGSAKGGIAFAIAQELRLPIYFLGLGQQVSDLAEFNKQDFIGSILQ